MLLGALALLLAAAPAKVAAPGLEGVNLSHEVVKFYSAHLVHELVREGVQVVTPEDILSVLGNERQRQLLGCADDQSSCLTELGNALGVDALIKGSVAKLGTGWAIEVKVISSANGLTLGALSDRVSSEDAVLDALSRAAHELAGTLTRRATVPSRVRKLSWVPVAAGAVLGAAAIGLGLSAWGVAGQLRDPAASFDYARAQNLYRDGLRYQTVAVVLTACTGAALLAGAAMFFFGGNEDVTLSVGAAPGAAALSVRFTFR